MEYAYSLFELRLFYLLSGNNWSSTWKVIRLYERRKKETQDSFEPNKSDSKNFIYVTERRNEIREKLHARFQNPKAYFI